MKGKLAQVLRYHCHHAGVVRARRHLAKYHFVALYKELYTENTVATQGISHSLGSSLSGLECLGAHGLRLP